MNLYDKNLIEQAKKTRGKFNLREERNDLGYYTKRVLLAATLATGLVLIVYGLQQALNYPEKRQEPTIEQRLQNLDGSHRY